jgi:hypothetical protein
MNATVMDLWMRCFSSGEIGEAEGITGAAVAEIGSSFSDVKKRAKFDLAAAEQATGATGRGGACRPTGYQFGWERPARPCARIRPTQ